MEDLHCSRCKAPREVEDNYCRQCGHQLTVTLPAVRPARALPSKPASIPTSVVGSVAVLALGTGLEWVVRRLARNAAGAAGRSLVGRERLPANRRQDARSEDVSVDEMVYVRRVQLRR